MNYEKIYSNLIESRKSRGLDKSKLEGYYEKHHIKPRCLGGEDCDENYVLLTYKEHILAHKLLQKINPSIPGLKTALILMLRITYDENGVKLIKKLNSREAEEVRELAINSQIGSKRSAETCKRISESKSEKNHPYRGKLGLNRLGIISLRDEMGSYFLIHR